MSVTVYSYVDDAVTASVQSQLAAQLAEKEKSVTETKTSSSESSASSADRIESFQTVLQNAERNVRAMAVDALVSLSQSGSVSTETIQKILGFNPAYASASSAQSTEETDLAAAEETAATTTSSSSSAGGSLSCSAELEAYFEEAADTYGVDVNLLKSIAKVESNFNADATSSAGAMGIMQLMPSTASSLGVDDPYDAYSNIMGGAKLISQNLEKYDGDISLALAAYNAGSGNVDKYGGIPPFTETINYVDKVLGYYDEASGEAA